MPRMVLVLVPFLALPLEERFLVRSSSASVTRSIDVRATPTSVWRHVVAVAPLAEDEFRSGLWQRLGIPRPLSATVTEPAVGSVRVGSFSGGMRVIEPIVGFEREHRLVLQVRLDPASLPAGSTTAHVFHSGSFRFAAVDYRLEPTPAATTRVRLTCSYTLRSSLPAYGQLWADAIIADFEARLLAALAPRCEAEELERSRAGGAGAAGPRACR